MHKQQAERLAYMKETIELILAIKPGGLFDVFYKKTELVVDKRQIDFQDEFYQRFKDKSDESLLFLGFSPDDISISESL